MIRPLQYRRLGMLGFLLVVALFAVGFRLVDLQVMRHQSLQRVAAGLTERTIILEPRRGDIRDARGNLLARSIFVKKVCADPSLMQGHHLQVAQALAPLLDMDVETLAKRLEYRTFVNAAGEVVPDKHTVLKSRVTYEVWEQIRQTMKTLSFGVDESSLSRKERDSYTALRTYGIYTEGPEEQVRVYPNKRLASHVLGIVGPRDRETNRGVISETVGKDGIEMVLNPALTGARGWRSTEVDRRQRELVSYRDQDVLPQPGMNVVLTIDAGVQYIVETELAEVMERHAPASASAVVVRPRTGEILAMATLPDYDPARPGDSPAGHRRNRVISDIAEPGSTFKIVVVSAALEEGLIGLQDKFDCENGRFYFAGRALRDHHSYGVLTVEEIITKSSNIGAAKIGIILGEQRLHDYIRAFGFGAATDIPLVGEVNGIVHPVSDWTKLSISRIPMGHEVAATPLQMVMAMSVIANEGRLMSPLLVARIEDQDGNVVMENKPQVVRQVIGSNAARLMTQALKTVVGKGGTAEKAALDHYVVAGKTGTAQKAVNGRYYPGLYYSSFAGFFPADKPEVCILVFLDEPRKNGYYGGIAAAPAFKAIAERVAKYLAVPPDKELDGEKGVVRSLAAAGLRR